MIAQADSRKWMACLYNSFLFMEAKIMKMAKKLLAVVLTGVMALSMLTGCALSDKLNEKKLMDALDVAGKSADPVLTYVEKDKDGSVDLKAAAKTIADAYAAVETTKNAGLKLNTYGKDTSVLESDPEGTDYFVVEVPTGNKTWEQAANAVQDALGGKADSNHKLTVCLRSFSTKAAATNGKSYDYIVVVVKAVA